jgi:diguanylate cyclase (GGDEF)-like protein
VPQFDDPHSHSANARIVMEELTASRTSNRRLSGPLDEAHDRGLEAARPFSRGLVVVVLTYFGVYLAWRLSSWGSVSSRAVVGDAFFVIPGFPTVALFWLASRRCAERRTTSAWRWLAVSIVVLTATFGVNLGYQALTGGVPFPSAADGCYIAFDVLFLVGLLRFPHSSQARAGRLRLWVDVATIVVAGATAIWFLVLGPIVAASGESLLNGTIAGAYPVADLLQIFGVTYVVTRVARRSTQRALLLLAAATLVAIVGDLTNGWMILHVDYSLKLGVDLAFMGGWALFVLAAPAQRNAVVDESSTADMAIAEVGWVPYLAPAVVLALVIYAQFGSSRTDRIGLAVGAVLVVSLVSVRQFLARRDLVSAQGELSYQALHDALTGLPNRALVLDRAEQMLAGARRQHHSVAALFLDVDGFKQINDFCGHAAGDELLKTVASRVSRVVREPDTVGRLGGDEFVILLESRDLDAGPELAAERILQVLRDPIELREMEGRPVSVTASIGIASTNQGTAEDLLRTADLALYEAKNMGRDRCVRFESDMQTIAQDRLLLEMDLREAIAGDQLFLLYQPTFDLRTETVIGVEALLRWRHPTRGIVAPGEFIPIAEQTGSIVPIGCWVLRQACQQAAEWRRQGHSLTMAVNVSARQLDGDDFVHRVDRALTASDLDPADLTLEITETTLMRNPDDTARRLRELKGLGVRVAIDDFGTGYSSLGYLRRFPVDALKIDRSFIEGIATSKEAAALIHTLVQLGKTLGLETLGEGIEDEAQLHALQNEQCDHGQGFLLARPLDVEAVERFLCASETRVRVA